MGWAQYVPVTDDEAVDAFEYLSRIEGIIPAIESAHAVAYARKLAPTMGKDQIIVVTISGQSDGAIVKLCAAYGAECVPKVKEYVKAMKDAVREN